MKLVFVSPFVFVGYRFKSKTFTGESFADYNNVLNIPDSLLVQAGLQFAVF